MMVVYVDARGITCLSNSVLLKNKLLHNSGYLERIPEGSQGIIINKLLKKCSLIGVTFSAFGY